MLFKWKFWNNITIKQNQKNSLENQEEYLRSYTNAKGVILDEVFIDIGSGINYNRKNFNKILELVESGEISEIYVTYKDRFVRFGFDWFNNFCENMMLKSLS